MTTQTGNILPAVDLKVVGILAQRTLDRTIIQLIKREKLLDLVKHWTSHMITSGEDDVTYACKGVLAE